MSMCKSSLTTTAKPQGPNSYQSQPGCIAVDEENQDARYMSVFQFNSIKLLVNILTIRHNITHYTLNNTLFSSFS